MSILTVWWKTISCTASTRVYLKLGYLRIYYLWASWQYDGKQLHVQLQPVFIWKCAGIVTWDVVLNVIFMFAISPWVFWGELYCVFLWTPNGKEYKFLLVCHRNLFCIFSNLSQFFQSVWLFLSCLSLSMIAVLALFYSSPVAPLLLSNEFLVNILWTSYEVHMLFFWNSSEILLKFLWSSYEVPMKFSWFW